MAKTKKVSRGKTGGASGKSANPAKPARSGKSAGDGAPRPAASGSSTSSTKSPRRGKAPKAGKAPKGAKGAQAKGPRAAAEAFPIVGIGASAGGLEAMTELLKGLPARTGVGFVLVQHLDPTHESALSAILARSTDMPVVEARHNMRLEPDRLHIIPPNKLMVISNRHLKLSPRRVTDTLLAVDHFFHSLAEDEGSRAIGVVLSGNGSDGTQGLLAIKAAGGITFAQDEQTAKYPAMPGSAIGAGCVDFVLSPKRIGRELGRIVEHPYVAPEAGGEPSADERPSEEKAFEEILAVLRQRTGVDFTHYKHATLQRRIQRRMALHKLEKLADYTHFLRSRAGETKELYNDILIHVTGFFRDAHAFGTFKKKICPRIMKNKSPEEAVRLWVPGCSTGEEAYSLAIALSEFLTERKLHNPVQIFGTDINDTALDKARAGIYPAAIRSDQTPERLRRFFGKTEGGYRINKAVREMCIFARQNVVTDPPFSNIDVISCRNVLIYLGAPLQRKVIPLFHYALRPGGFLMLGSSETVGGFGELFSLVDKRARVYAKKATHLRPAVTFGHGLPEPQVSSEEAPPPVAVGPGIADVQKQADRVLLTQFSPAGVIINRHMEVLQFRGHTGAYLEHAHGEASLHLLRMAREELMLDLRTVVAKAVKQNVRARQEGVRLKQNGETITVDLEAIPFNVPPSSERFYLVLFERAAPAEPAKAARPAKPRAGKKRLPPPPAAAAGETARLRDELAATRESLQAIIEEQEATNEELRSANEEIMSSNEELQSTNEELETAKEELQSTNEELTTLNDELEHVNNDLHNLLASVNLPIIMLGQDLRIRRFTGMAERTLNLIPSDIGRPITDIKLPVEIPRLDKLVGEVVDTLATKDLELQDADKQWWSVRIRPYKTTDNKIDGAVLALVDIDALKSGMEKLDDARLLAEGMASAVPQPMLVLGADLSVQAANPAFYRTFQLAPEQTINARIYDLAAGHWDIPKLRSLLEEILPHNTNFEGFTVEHDFPGVGRKKLSITARRLAGQKNETRLILMTIEDLSRKQAG